LLLDEPFTGGLDPSGILALKRVLSRLAERKDRTVIMTAPVPELVEEIGQKIIVLRDGIVVAHDTLEGLRRQAPGACTLEEILATLIHPKTIGNIELYFGETPTP